MKNTTNPFKYCHNGNTVEIWEGPAGHPESECVLQVDVTLVPALIAILKLATGSK